MTFINVLVGLAIIVTCGLILKGMQLVDLVW